MGETWPQCLVKKDTSMKIKTVCVGTDGGKQLCWEMTTCGMDAEASAI